MKKSTDSLKGARLELVSDNKKAAHSPNTRLVASALACGFKYGTDKPFMESYEEVDGETQVSVTWLMDASTKVPFTWVENQEGKLIAREESITFGEFRSRYIDREWIEANPDHPISYLRATHTQHLSMLKTIAKLPKHHVIRKGSSKVSIPDNATPEERAYFLNQLNKRR